MALPENQSQSPLKITAWDYLEALLRVIAMFLGLTSLLGSFWAARDGSYPNITALALVLLMFLCVGSPWRPSRAMLTALLIALILAGIDFVWRALPSLQRENYPLNIVMTHLVELIIAIWFIRKHLAAGPLILRKR